MLVLRFPHLLHSQTQNPLNQKKALTAAILKQENPMGNPKSYRPILLLCVPFKILERLIYFRVESIIDPQFPQDQTGFRHDRSTIDVTLLT